MAGFFRDQDNVVFAECHNVQEALEAISEHNPDVIFLDHSLSEGGQEGFEIVDKVKDIKIFSTSANSDLATQYAKMGVEYISPTDLPKLKEIIE